MRYAFAGLLLYLDCWRLSLTGPFQRSHHSPRTHPIITEPKQTERFPMFLYLLRHAFRQLGREPAFTVAALLTLAFYLWDAFISTAPSRRRDGRWIGRIALLVGLGVIVAAWNLLLRT